MLVSPLKRMTRTAALGGALEEAHHLLDRFKRSASGRRSRAGGHRAGWSMAKVTRSVSGRTPKKLAVERGSPRGGDARPRRLRCPGAGALPCGPGSTIRSRGRAVGRGSAAERPQRPQGSPAAREALDRPPRPARRCQTLSASSSMGTRSSRGILREPHAPGHVAPVVGDHYRGDASRQPLTGARRQGRIGGAQPREHDVEGCGDVRDRTAPRSSTRNPSTDSSSPPARPTARGSRSRGRAAILGTAREDTGVRSRACAPRGSGGTPRRTARVPRRPG